MQEGRDFHGLFLSEIAKSPAYRKLQTFLKSISQFVPTIRPERAQQFASKSNQIIRPATTHGGESLKQPPSNQKGVKYFPPNKAQQRSARELFSVASYGDSPSHPFYLLPSFIMTLRQDAFSVHLLQTAIDY